MDIDWIDKFVNAPVWVLIASSFGIWTLAVGIVVWFFRTSISEWMKNSIRNFYESQLEIHKNELNLESQKQLERIRADFRIASLEYEIRFSSLHVTRANTIAETYACLREVYDLLAQVVNPLDIVGSPTKDEIFKQLVESYNKFVGYYSKRIIYFPRGTAEKLTKISREMRNAVIDFDGVIQFEEAPDRTKKWHEIYTRVSNDIQEALKELEDEFRRLLGDND